MSLPPGIIARVSNVDLLVRFTPNDSSVTRSAVGERIVIVGASITRLGGNVVIQYCERGNTLHNERENALNNKKRGEGRLRF